MNIINDAALRLVQVLMETTDTNMVQAVYTYGRDLISAQIGEIRGYYHYDGLGSTRQLTDNSGTVTKSYTYDSFGNVIASTGTSVNAYGFTGEQQLEEPDDLVFLRARYYEPRIGRFISRDPIGYAGGINLYAYCRNNPINLTDPTGLGDRYDICKGLSGIPKIICKKMVDAACNFSVHTAMVCCEADKNSCLVDIPCDDPEADAKKAMCVAKYIKCLAGIKKKE